MDVSVLGMLAETRLSGPCVVQQVQCCWFKHVRGGTIVSPFLRAVLYR